MSVKIGFVNELNISSDLVREFYEKNWSSKISLSDKKFYEWQFLGAPDNSGSDYCVVAYDEDHKKILGVMGLNKREFYLRDVKKNGAELTTWIVANDSLGLGLGSKILSYIQKHFEVLIGMGITQMAIPIYMRCGFRYLKSIPRFVKVINFEKIKPYSQYENITNKIVEMWKPDLTDDFVAEPFNKEKYLEIEQLLRSFSNSFSRSIDHLTWRYKNHPYFIYKEFLVGSVNNESNNRAYVALREEIILSHFKMLHVMDLFGDEKSILFGLKFIQNYALDNNFDVIDFYCTSSYIYRHLLALGWFSVNDDTHFRFPHLFHPIELREPPTTSLIYWARDNFEDLADTSRLYITKQDADLDRPTGYTLGL